MSEANGSMEELALPERGSSFLSSFFKSSGTGGSADHANGDSVAVSRERWPNAVRPPDAEKGGS